MIRIRYIYLTVLSCLNFILVAQDFNPNDISNKIVDCSFNGDSMVLSRDLKGDTVWYFTVDNEGFIEGKFLFYDKGKLSYQGCVENRLFNGSFITYYKKGEIQSITNFKSGLILSNTFYYKRGKVKEIYIPGSDKRSFKVYYKYSRKGREKRRKEINDKPLVFYIFRGKYLSE